MVRHIRPVFFGLALLAFLLPFTSVSCGREDSTDSNLATEESGRDFYGYDLLFGQGVEEFRELQQVTSDEDIRLSPEPSAVMAAIAGLAGLVFTLWPPLVRIDSPLPLAAAVTGTISLVTLGMWPALETFGLARTQWKIGYFAALFAFIGAALTSILVMMRSTHPSDSPAPGNNGVRL